MLQYLLLSLSLLVFYISLTPRISFRGNSVEMVTPASRKSSSEKSTLAASIQASLASAPVSGPSLSNHAQHGRVDSSLSSPDVFASPISTPSTPTTNEELTSLKQRARLAFERGDFLTSAKLFTLMITLSPSMTYYRSRSLCYGNLCRYAEAIADATKVIELKPSGNAYYRRAALYERVHDIARARADILTGLALEPKSKELATALATVKRHLHTISQVVTDGNRESDYNPSNSNTNPHVNPEEGKFIALISWLSTGGAKFPKLMLQYYGEDSRGVCARETVSAQEMVLYVPHRYILTSEVARASSIGNALLSTGLEVRSKHSYIAACLLEEREKTTNSFWWPYISILPVKFANVPLFFPDDMLEWLKGSSVLPKIADRLLSMRIEYHNICAAYPPFSRFSYDSFAWARIAVITRIFGIVVDGLKTDGLVPLADMLNHKLPRETKWNYDSPTRGFVITALTEIEQGAQVFDSYGRKCNGRFFVNYGFALDVNEDNESVLRAQLKELEFHDQREDNEDNEDDHDDNFQNNDEQINSSIPTAAIKTGSEFDFLLDYPAEMLARRESLTRRKLAFLQRLPHSMSQNEYFTPLPAFSAGIPVPSDEVLLLQSESQRKAKEVALFESAMATDTNINRKATQSYVNVSVSEKYPSLCSLAAKREYQVPASLHDKKTIDLFAFLRVAVATSKELNTVKTPSVTSATGMGVVAGSSSSVTTSLPLAFEKPLGPRNELAAMKALQRSCLQRLEEFPNSLQKDISLLLAYYPGEETEEKRGVSAPVIATLTKAELENTSQSHRFVLPLFSNERNCVLMRKGEKEVLCWLANIALKVQLVIAHQGNIVSALEAYQLQKREERKKLGDNEEDPILTRPGYIEEVDYPYLVGVPNGHEIVLGYLRSTISTMFRFGGPESDVHVRYVNK